MLSRSIGPLALGICALALPFRVLPRLERTLRFHLCKPMLLLGSKVFAFCALVFCFGPQLLGVCLASSGFGSKSFLVSPHSLFAGASQCIIDAPLKVFDFRGAREPCTVSFCRQSVLLLGSLVLAGRSLLLPIGTLSLVIDALACLGYPRGNLLALCVLMLGVFEFAPGTFTIGFGLGVDPFYVLALLVCSLSFGVSALPLGLGSGMVLVRALVFRVKLEV